LDHFGVSYYPNFSHATLTASISSIKNHPRFSIGNATYDNDISLVKLRDRIVFSERHKLVPVCLPGAEKGENLENKQNHNHNGFGVNSRKNRMEAFLSLNCGFEYGNVEEKRMIIGVYNNRKNYSGMKLFFFEIWEKYWYIF
jgi:hypothetical protein